MKVMFLDYDGVVNIPMWNTEGKVCNFSFPSDNTVNNFQAVQWISEFCQKFDYKIVITSSWRRKDNYADCLRNGGLRAGIEILGRTEVLDNVDWRIKRGSEIEKYLKDHPEIDYYIIIDDENIALDCQKLHFVQTNANVGFLLDDFDKAKRIADVDTLKGDSFWDRIDTDISDEALLLKRLEAKFEYAKQNHAECLQELHRLADVMDAAERDLNQVKFKGKTCETCRYSAVFTTSFDDWHNWHNICGCEDAGHVCSNAHCEHYLPDNTITQFIKDNNLQISPKCYEALKTLCGDMMKFDVDASGPAIDKMKNIIKAWRNMK